MNTSKLKLIIEIYITFMKLGCFSFGGGYAMIPLIEHEVVEVKKWVDKKKLIDIFTISQSLPGAIALNSSTFVGYYLAGIKGAIVALVGNLTLPVVIILTLSILLNIFEDMPILQSAFLGIRPVVIAMILNAGYRIGKTAISDLFGIIVAISAFSMALFLKIAPIPIIIFGAGIGILICHLRAYKTCERFVNFISNEEVNE